MHHIFPKPPGRLRRLASTLNPFRWLPQTNRLQRQLKRVDRDYRGRIAAAKATKETQHELLALQARRSMDVREIRDEMESLRTERLTSDAYRLDVPLPPLPPGDDVDDEGNEWWKHGTFGLYLATAGINRLRGDIHAERKARREAWSYWLNWIGALTGLLGALAAVLALLRK